MRHTRALAAVTLAALLAVAACAAEEPTDATRTSAPATSTGTSQTTAPTETTTPEKLTLLTHDSFAGSVTDDTFAAFTDDTGIEIEVLAGGDAGTMVNQAVLSKDSPLAEVLFGIDDTFLSRALDEGIFVPYESKQIDSVPITMRDPDNLVTPIDYGDVCFNYDKDWFENSSLDIPNSLDDLVSPDYASLVTVEHPATSSPGLAFMLATIDAYGEDGWINWWQKMKENGINVVADWDTAYYGEFTRYGGDSPLVMSYASSPPAEVIFAEEPLDEAPTGVIEAGCYRQTEYAGILDGTDFADSAGGLIDFMLSPEFQEGIPETWFVFPANRDVGLPQTFVDYTIIPENPADLEAAYIAANRDVWIDEWVAVMEG